MNCPRCHSTMKEVKNKDVVVAICEQGCGGIWFDWQELRRMDETHEADPEFFAKLPKSFPKKVDHNNRITCPDCKDIIMMRRFESIKRQIELDECPKCGGVWLDSGELSGIHSQFKTEADKQKATEQMINELFAKDMEAIRKQSKEQLQTADKFNKVFQYITPSRYLKKLK